MSEEPPKRRGGKREGAGRKPESSGGARVYLTLRLAPITIESLDRLALPNEPRARTIDRLVAHYSQAYDPADRP